MEPYALTCGAFDYTALLYSLSEERVANSRDWAERGQKDTELHGTGLMERNLGFGLGCGDVL